jgi:sensor histidine kinase regulating citrate/malate metabolism
MNRGSGLLEVQDAVQRLHGEVRLIEEIGHYRLKIMLPKVEP